MDDFGDLRETELGELPADWEVAELNECVTTRSGGTPSRKNPEYWNGTIPWVKTTEVNYRPILATEETITEEGLNNSSAKVFPAGTLLMAMYGQGVTRGRVATLGIDAATNQACAALFVNNRILTQYLHEYLRYSYQSIRELGHGANQRNLSAEIIRTIPIALPPLAEQRRIAAVLNAIQDAIAAQEDVIAAARALKRSLMQRLYTYGPYREPAETKETEIGEIPQHWEVVELGSHFELLSGYAFKSERYTDDFDAPRLLRGDNIAQGRIRWTDEKRWPWGETEGMNKFWLRPGDVVLAMDRPWIPAGMKCAMVTESDVPSLLVQRVARLRPKDFDAVLFVKHLLIGQRFAEYVLSVQTGTSVPHISGRQIRSFTFGLPPVNEQIRVGEALENVDAKIAAEEDRLTALQTLFRSMLHQLMTGQIRLLSDEGGNDQFGTIM